MAASARIRLRKNVSTFARIEVSIPVTVPITFFIASGTVCVASAAKASSCGRTHSITRPRSGWPRYASSPVHGALYRVLLTRRLFEPTVDIRRLLAQRADQPHGGDHQQEEDQQDHQGRRRPVSSPELPPEPLVQREGDHREDHPDADGGQERPGELVHEVREEGEQGAGDERGDHSAVHVRQTFSRDSS